ncbi:type I-B CRISPR-associated protein Cas7/Cst2/DevR [Methanobrevibacter millerae]|uniref:CRISPR-associated autoregulator, Cst2 family n=1 Tax=Methanobrevibacter millerae TaxID=230361 RepID=A0A1G5VHM7_9EURY|nr:type I-B CRISPR-associated protein Cas7/Cst2/DevR [Methanobrevibacter millerae]SDA45208.1 CRISPR-associated autoregulator, Cst2 family [Methanobrevibacter millerae]
MSMNILGLMLIDAPHSALNNAGSDAGERTDNIVRVKTIRKGRRRYPYVSAQAFRYWLRETLKERFDWKMSPITRESKIAFTKANPIEYPDDDVFGYMRAMKKKDGGTVTRISPLKNSPLISVVGQNPTSDFGVMARHEGDPVPYEHEFYSTVLKGMFSIDLTSLGVFCESEKSGYRNMHPKLVELADEKGLIHKDDCWMLDDETRIARAQDIINALPYLSGGAKNTSHLTDVTPKILLLAAIDSGNHIFMNIIREENEESVFDIDALDEVINEYSDILKTDVYIGLRKGFMKDTQDKIIEYAKDNDNVHIGTIKETTDKFSEEIPKLI